MESKYGPISIRKEMKNGRKNEKGINEKRQEKREECGGVRIISKR